MPHQCAWQTSRASLRLQTALTFSQRGNLDQEAELVKRQEAHWAAGNLPGGYDDDDDDGNAPDGAAAPAPQPQPAVNVRAISNGAADLKALLADARAADTAALVLWTDSAASAAADGGGASNRADTGVTAAASGSEAAGSEAAAGDAAGGAPARAAGAAAGSSSDDSAASADVPNVLGAAVAALDEPTALAGHIDIAASRANRSVHMRIPTPMLAETPMPASSSNIAL